VTEEEPRHDDRAPRIISRSEHQISRANISDNALKVLYRLKNAGYQAYLVGGGVRDLSLGREPKDFDVATDARPEEVAALFRNCRLIGRRFRLAHVHFGREIVEVATFRALHDSDSLAQGEVEIEDGRIIRDNAYGTLEEDAMRRDFTVNALYYNIADFSVVDYAGGMADLETGTLRLIGDPEIRFREDPVRMLRAVRFAVKLGFRMSPETSEPLPRMAVELEHVAPARLFDELLKLLMSGMGAEGFEALRQHGLFGYLFPHTETSLNQDEFGIALGFISRALESTDLRIADDKPVTPAFLFGALLWPAVFRVAKDLEGQGDGPAQALNGASEQVVAATLRRLTIPKRFTVPMREIWVMQSRFERRGGKRALRLLSHPRFRAAYDFYLLRGEAGDADAESAAWWREFVENSPEARQHAAAESGRTPGRRRGGRRRSRRSTSSE